MRQKEVIARAVSNIFVLVYNNKELLLRGSQRIVFFAYYKELFLLTIFILARSNLVLAPNGKLSPRQTKALTFPFGNVIEQGTPFASLKAIYLSMSTRFIRVSVVRFSGERSTTFFCSSSVNRLKSDTTRAPQIDR